MTLPRLANFIDLSGTETTGYATQRAQQMPITKVFGRTCSMAMGLCADNSMYD